MYKNKKKAKKRLIAYGIIAAVLVLLNIVAWISADFSDYYIEHIFPVWVNTYGRVTGLFPFSVGERLLWLAVALGGLSILNGLIWLVWHIVYEFNKRDRDEVTTWNDVGSSREISYVSRSTKKVIGQRYYTQGPNGRKPRIRGIYANGFLERMYRFPGFCKVWFQVMAWIVLGVFTVMTLNCTILYHASTFSERYFGALTENGTEGAEFTTEELIAVRNMVVEQCNALALQMKRDSDGNVIYEGDMKAVCIEAMQRLGNEYHNLSGFYPRPKALTDSDFMCQQYMQGYYFPFSMEANYNDVMYIMNKPSTFCHELAHLRGYIYEDEANLIGYLACVGSDDPMVRYSGYLGVLGYLDNDFYKAVGQDIDAYKKEPLISQRVIDDDIFVSQEEWDRINKKAVLDTELVSEASDIFVETNLKVNGVTDGKISYSRVVQLLLQYYRLHSEEL